MNFCKILAAIFMAFAVSGALEAAEPTQRRMTREEYRQYLERLKLRKQQAGQADKNVGVYQKYQPTPQPTPVGATRINKQAGTVISMHKPKLTVAIKGGLVLPLSDLAKHHDGGGGGQLDLIYRAANNLSLDAYVHYASVAYKKSKDPAVLTSSDPLTALGGGLRALYHPFEIKSMTPHIGAGLGYASVKRASFKEIGKDPVNPAVSIFEVESSSSSGLVFTGVVGATYHMTPNFGLTIDITIYSVSLDGGTSDTPNFALAGAGVAYTF